jgi:hypothetical protein
MNSVKRLFSSIVGQALEEGISLSSFTRRFEVAESTVIRWIKMKSSPHPLMRRQIIWHISALKPSNLLAQRIEEYFSLKFECEKCGVEADHLHTCPLKKD